MTSEALTSPALFPAREMPLFNELVARVAVCMDKIRQAVLTRVCPDNEAQPKRQSEQQPDRCSVVGALK